MKEAQKFELLKILQSKSEKGQKFIEEALKNASSKEIYISGLFFKYEELEKCKNILSQAKKALTIKDMKHFLKEDTIPMGLLYKEKFWQEFQDIIDCLYKD